MLKTSCAIMFADVSGSTRMYDQLGDEAAKRTIDKCLGQMQVVTETHNGIVIKKIGDELMCRFDRADEALSAARVSQLEIKSLGALENALLSIRAGIHYGNVIEDDDDISRGHLPRGAGEGIPAALAPEARSSPLPTK